MASVIENKPSPSLYHASAWSVGLVGEIIAFGATLRLYSKPHHEPKAGDRNGGRLEKHTTTWEVIEIIMDLSRLLCLVAMVSLYGLFVYLHRTYPTNRDAEIETSMDESTTLLETQETAENSEDSTEHSIENSTDTTVNGGVKVTPSITTYGTINKPPKGVDEDAGWVRPEKLPSKNWWEYVSAYSLFIPYLWPAKDLRLQAAVVACFILMVLASGVNLLVPIAAGKITDALAGEDEPPYLPVTAIFIFIGLKLLQGPSGYLTSLREYLWIPISQYSYLELSVAAFEHVHGLSLDFHLGKKTGEVLSALNKGNSINTFLGQVTFQFFPMLVDLSIAIFFFFYVFDPYQALAVAAMSSVYMYTTMWMASRRSSIRRTMVNLDREAEGVK